MLKVGRYLIVWRSIIIMKNSYENWLIIYTVDYKRKMQNTAPAQSEHTTFALATVLSSRLNEAHTNMATTCPVSCPVRAPCVILQMEAAPLLYRGSVAFSYASVGGRN